MQIISEYVLDFLFITSNIELKLIVTITATCTKDFRRANVKCAVIKSRDRKKCQLHELLTSVYIYIYTVQSSKVNDFHSSSVQPLIHSRLLSLNAISFVTEQQMVCILFIFRIHAKSGSPPTQYIEFI